MGKKAEGLCNEIIKKNIQDLMEQCWLYNRYGGTNQLQYEIEQCLAELNRVAKDLISQNFNDDSLETINRAWSKLSSLKAG
ncbi:MAG: hypothetical protein KDD40_09460 [Bdellovibrionales bacterium]|nr:hypothetical protein [Bdellovibrionales bacterium]